MIQRMICKRDASGYTVEIEHNDTTRWWYTVIQDVATTEERNITSCLLHGSSDNITVVWIETRVDYLIVVRPYQNKTDSNDDSSSSDDHHHENVFNLGSPGEATSREGDIYYGGPTKAPVEATSRERDINYGGNTWDDRTESIAPEIINATIARIQNGTLLEWIQQREPNVVGVTQVGQEDSARCAMVDEHPDLAIPFIKPVQTPSWGLLQTLGSVVFILTVGGTTLLCLVGRNRSKAIKQWSAVIGDESAVDDFLKLSREFLPPECLNQRGEGAAVLVTMPHNNHYE